MVSAATTVTASFALNQYTLTVNPAGTGVGVVSSFPAGISCGGICSHSLNYGPVTLSASPSQGSDFDGWSGGVCTGNSSCAFTLSADTTVTATFTSACNYYVSNTGSDGNPGTFAQPFKTITHAMAVASSGKTVRVMPGTYNTTTGEVFPIAIKSGVQLFGDVPNKGDGLTPTLVSGVGPVDSSDSATFTSTGTGGLSGFKLSGPRIAAPIAYLVWASDSDISLDSNTFSDAWVGIFTDGATCPTIQRNVFNTNQSYYGITSYCGGYAKILNNVFNTPAIALRCDGNPLIDGNTIQGSGQGGIEALASPTISNNTFINSRGYYDVGYGAINVLGPGVPSATAIIRSNHFESIGTAKAINISEKAWPDIGGATSFGDPGLNYFANSYIEIDSGWINEGRSIYAFGNYWNSGPTCGVNIRSDTGEILWDGGNHCP
jgi:parallel beta-helix repeat protein